MCHDPIWHVCVRGRGRQRDGCFPFSRFARAAADTSGAANPPSRSFCAGSGGPKLGAFALRAALSTSADVTLVLGSLLSSPRSFLSTCSCVKRPSRAAERPLCFRVTHGAVKTCRLGLKPGLADPACPPEGTGIVLPFVCFPAGGAFVCDGTLVASQTVCGKHPIPGCRVLPD